MKMTEFKVEIGDELNRILEDPKEKTIQILIVLELYREGKLTLRQAASILRVAYRDYLELMAKHGTYLNYGLDEALEDIEFSEISSK